MEEASRTAAREKKKRQRDSLSPEEARVKRQKNTEAKRKARGAIVSSRLTLDNSVGHVYYLWRILLD